MQQLTAQQLHEWLNDTSLTPPLLLDVRERWEVEIASLAGAVHIPMSAIGARASKLDTAVDTVVICHHGARSFQVAMFLERSGFERIYNLHGGVDAWARQVDASLPTY